jgi:hypothetical protein
MDGFTVGLIVGEKVSPFTVGPIDGDNVGKVGFCVGETVGDGV